MSKETIDLMLTWLASDNIDEIRQDVLLILTDKRRECSVSTIYVEDIQALRNNGMVFIKECM